MTAADSHDWYGNDDDGAPPIADFTFTAPHVHHDARPETAQGAATGQDRGDYDVPPAEKVARSQVLTTALHTGPRASGELDYDPFDAGPVLSPRAANVLVHEGFRSVRAAQATPDERLLAIRDCGVGVVQEINKLRLGTRSETTPGQRQRPTREQAQQLLAEQLTDRVRRRGWAMAARGSLDWLLRPDIDRAATRLGSGTLADLLALPEHKLTAGGLGLGDLCCLRELAETAQLDDLDDGSGHDDSLPLTLVPLLPRVRETLTEIGVETTTDLAALTLGELAQVHGLGRAGALYVAVPASAAGVTVATGETEAHDAWEHALRPDLGPRQQRKTPLSACGLTQTARDELEALHNKHLYDLTTWDPSTLRKLVSVPTWCEVGYLLGHLRLGWRDTVTIPTFHKPFLLALDYAIERGEAPGGNKDFLYKGERLGQWVMWVRQQRKAVELDAAREHALETIPGWAWDRAQGVRARREEEVVVAAEKHVAEHDALRLATGNPLFKDLTQVRADGPDALTAHQRSRLEALPGWTWNQDTADEVAAQVRLERRRQKAPTAEWLANWDRVREVAEQHHGLDNVEWSAVPDGATLSHWVSTQRSRRRQLTAPQIDHLEQLPGWLWNGMEARDARRWLVNYQRLTRYAAEHGTTKLSVTEKYEGVGLGGWVRRQRRSRDTLTTEQVAQLETLPEWAWHSETPAAPRRASAISADTRLRWELKWEATRRLAAEYYVANGHWPPTGYVTDAGLRLGHWVLMQRSAGRAGKLPENRYQALDRTPGWRWHGQAQRGGRHGMTFQRMCEVLGIAPGTLLTSKPRSMYQVEAIVNENLAIDLGTLGADGLETPQRAWIKATGHQSTAAGWDMWGVETDGEWTSLRELREQAAARENGAKA